MANKENETRENSQHRNKEGHSSKNFIAGAVIGGVVGAAAALLLTPKSGKEIRNGLNSQVNTLLEKTTQLSDDVFEKSTELAAVTKEKTSVLSKAVVEQSRDLVNKAKGLTNNTVAEENTEDQSNYISLKPKGSKASSINTSDDQKTDIRKKLEEAQRAFDEAENSIKK